MATQSTLKGKKGCGRFSELSGDMASIGGNRLQTSMLTAGEFFAAGVPDTIDSSLDVSCQKTIAVCEGRVCWEELYSPRFRESVGYIAKAPEFYASRSL
jgi:hypothetical protein